jgi:uncharacterized protein YndB with AHSA1/START domain
MSEIMDELAATTRETATAKTPVGEGHTVVLRRTYPADIDDLWEAVTTAERINRWFLPISGDLRLGGHYQFEGNAGGEVLVCEPPRVLRVSWVMGEPSPDSFSEVEVRLSPVDGGTLFELEHTATVPPEMWDQFGPGAVGVGWDGALLGLALHLASGGGVSIEDNEAWAASDDGRRFLTASSRAWGEAYRAAGASPDVAGAAVAATTAFYVPPQ